MTIVLYVIMAVALAASMAKSKDKTILALKKGSKLSNVLIMLGAWSTTKIPMLLFEASSMGIKFTVLRLILDLFGVALIAYFTEKLLSTGEKEDIYQKAMHENSRC